MSVTLDIIIAAIIVITVFSTTKKGFIKAIFGMLRFIVSVICALFFKNTVAEAIMQTPLYKDLLKKASMRITETINEALMGVADNIADGFNANNSGISKLIYSFCENSDELWNNISNAYKSGTDEVFKAVSENIVVPAFESIVRIIAFLFIFIAVYAVLSVAKKILSKVFELPILRTVNLAGGFTVGVICAVLYSSLFVAIANPFITKSEVFGMDFNSDVCKDTILYSFFEENNIFKNIIN